MSIINCYATIWGTGLHVWDTKFIWIPISGKVTSPLTNEALRHVSLLLSTTASRRNSNNLRANRRYHENKPLLNLFAHISISSQPLLLLRRYGMAQCLDNRNKFQFHFPVLVSHFLLS
jgi:hypothetical protein